MCIRDRPNIIASELCGKINEKKCFSKIEPVAAYINFFTNKGLYAETVMEKIISEGENYGRTEEEMCIRDRTILEKTLICLALG